MFISSKGIWKCLKPGCSKECYIAEKDVKDYCGKKHVEEHRQEMSGMWKHSPKEQRRVVYQNSTPQYPHSKNNLVYYVNPHVLKAYLSPSYEVTYYEHGNYI